jgi:uncharacterized protein (UPF0332 family)
MRAHRATASQLAARVYRYREAHCPGRRHPRCASKSFRLTHGSGIIEFRSVVCLRIGGAVAADWHSWQEMADESLSAARTLQKEGQFRSCASRVYYASYQAVSAVHLYIGMTPPPEREAWSHEDTPKMIEDHWHKYEGSRDKRREIARKLRSLYNLRLSADYFGDGKTNGATAQKAVRDASFILKTAYGILPER